VGQNHGKRMQLGPHHPGKHRRVAVHKTRRGRLVFGFKDQLNHQARARRRWARGCRKPAPEERNLYSPKPKNQNSSGGATSSRESPSMPLLAELVAFNVTVTIKISLLRSCQWHRFNQARRRMAFFSSLVESIVQSRLRLSVVLVWL
jgi:hypothetical protein